MGRNRYKFIYSDQTYFVTLTVLHWIPVFTRPPTIEIIFNSLKFLISDGLKVHAFVVLENHMHMVVQSESIDRDIARFKSFTGKQIVEFLSKHKIKRILDQLAFYKKAHKADRTYQFQEEGVHPEWIQNEQMMRQKIEYIHQNPVKRGYVDDASHWRYSSARNYAGEEGLLEVSVLW